MRIHEHDTWRNKAFHVGSVHTGVFIVIGGPQTYLVRAGHVRYLIKYSARIPGAAGGLAGGARRRGRRPRRRHAGSRSASERASGYKFGIFHLQRFNDRRRHTPVMKIPTLEFRLTLEIFAELCGCRRADFLKNGVCYVYFSLRFMEAGMCSALVYLRAAFLMKLRCFIAYEPF